MKLIASSSEAISNSHIRSLQNNNEKSQTNENVELRSRSKQVPFVDWRNNDDDCNAVNNTNNRINIDHKIKDGDTLNSIAIQYSVQVFKLFIFKTD